MRNAFRLGAIRLALLASAPLLVAAPAIAQDKGLQMVSVDVEGGGGTLFVTPEGSSLLIDTGNPEESGVTGAKPSSLRIMQAARKLGVKKIDYVLITHYHSDHVGGVEGLVKRMPVGTFIDHGENRETTANTLPNAPQIDLRNPPPGSTQDFYNRYLVAIKGHPRLIKKAGDTMQIGSMTLTFVSSDGDVIPKPLPGAGYIDPSCATMQHMEVIGGEENARSLGTIITYGKARIAALGDLTWDKEKALFCPDRVGPVDVYLATHHGTPLSGSPASVNALRPVVSVMGNSPIKGANPERIATINSSPRNKALWKLHGARNNPEVDGDPSMISNPDPDSAKDGFYNLRLSIMKDGTVTVINERNGFTKPYKAS